MPEPATAAQFGGSADEVEVAFYEGCTTATWSS